jgi:hypothetical protein
MLKNNLSSKFGIVLDGGLFNYEKILHACHFYLDFFVCIILPKFETNVGMVLCQLETLLSTNISLS